MRRVLCGQLMRQLALTVPCSICMSRSVCPTRSTFGCSLSCAYRAAGKLAMGGAGWATLNFALLYCLVKLDPASEPRGAANSRASTSAAATGAVTGSEDATFVAQLLQRGGFSLEDSSTWGHAHVEHGLCRDVPAFRAGCQRLQRAWYGAACS